MREYHTRLYHILLLISGDIGFWVNLQAVYGMNSPEEADAKKTVVCAMAANSTVQSKYSGTCDGDSGGTVAACMDDSIVI